MLNRIEWRRRLVARHLAMHDMIQDVKEQLESSGKATLQRRGDVLTLHASSLVAGADGWTLKPKNGTKRVRVDVRLANGTSRTHTATAARLRFRDLGTEQSGLATPDEQGGRVWLRLDLEDVATSGTVEAGTGEVAEGNSAGGGGAGGDGAGGDAAGEDGAADTRDDAQSYSVLTTRRDHVAERLQQNSKALLEATASIVGDSDTDNSRGASETAGTTDLRRAAKELSTKIDDLKREAVSKLHERAAFSVSCLLMVVCGAVVALRLHAALPLQVYLWSFFPALVCVITISAGQGLTHKVGSSGLALLWGGVAGLALFTSLAYASLRRH